jgi:hypothetical protein
MRGTNGHSRRSTAIALLLLAGIPAYLPAQRDSVTHDKSPGTALALSLGATTVPYLFAAIANRGNDDGGNEVSDLLVLALFAGPAVGHFYAGQPGRGLTGVGVRIGITGAMALLGPSGALGDCRNQWVCLPPGLVIGALAVMASAIVDIAAAPGSARKTNAERAHLVLVPLRDGPRSQLGVGMQLRF